MSERPLLVLVGIGFEPHRGYLLRSIAETTDVWLLDHEPVSWEAPYVVGGTAVDVRDGAALLAATPSTSPVAATWTVCCAGTS